MERQLAQLQLGMGAPVKATETSYTSASEILSRH